MSSKPAEADLPPWFSDRRFKKADLHCHSVHSTFKYFRIANTRDSYNRPEEVYRVAKERGMDFVTLSDHDSIDGCLASRMIGKGFREEQLDSRVESGKRVEGKHDEFRKRG